MCKYTERTARTVTKTETIEPFIGVELHMEMDNE